MKHPSLAILLSTLTFATGCSKSEQRYDTTIDVLQVKRLGTDAATPSYVDLEIRFGECPGDVRRVVRADKEFAACASRIKAGDKVPATVSLTWSTERSNYRSDFVSIAGCPIKVDTKDEANYELVQVCSDLKATGTTVGVHCDRTRNADLVAKCPWMRRE